MLCLAIPPPNPHPHPPHIVQNSEQKKNKEEQMDQNKSGQWTTEPKGQKVAPVTTPVFS